MVSPPTDCKHAVSGSISLPVRGSFHLSLSVLCAIGHQRYLALEGGPPSFRRDFTCPALLGNTPQGVCTFSPTGLSPSMARLSSTIRLTCRFVTPRAVCRLLRVYPTTPMRQRRQAITPHRFGLFPFRSPLLRESRLISFPVGTEMFHFPTYASCLLRDRIPGFLPGGFPHSGIHGSTPACGSPWLIAACHALHRPLVPRHPPRALSTLTPIHQLSFIIYLSRCLNKRLSIK